MRKTREQKTVPGIRLDESAMTDGSCCVSVDRRPELEEAEADREGPWGSQEGCLCLPVLHGHSPEQGYWQPPGVRCASWPSCGVLKNRRVPAAWLSCLWLL